MKSSTAIIFQTIISLAIFYYLSLQGGVYYPQYENYINILLSILSLKILYTNIPVLIDLIRARYDI